jgi:hypothetical protein
MPAAIAANGLAKEEPAILTAVVDGPYSLSACKIKILSITSTNIAGTLKSGSVGS